MSIRLFITALLLSIFSSIFLSPKLFAAPSAQIPYEIEQPDGSRFHALTKGDEWHNRTETLEGYTIQQSDDGYWYYVEGYVDDKAMLSASRADIPPVTILPKHVKPDKLPEKLLNKANGDKLSKAPVGSFS